MKIYALKAANISSGHFSIRFFSTVLFFCTLATNNILAQNQLEMATASYASPPNGPTVANQTATMLENTSGTTFAAFTPSITYTLSFSNQQYTAVSGISTSTGLSIGTSLNSSAKSAVAASVVNPLGAIGTGVNANHTSSPTGTAGTGMDMTANFGFRLFAAVEPLYVSSAALNGRYYLGDLIISFNRPVSDPVLQIVGLGGTFASGGKTQGYSMEYELQSTGFTLSELSGSSFFAVNANKILNSNPGAINATCAGGGACGSVKVAGTNITSVVFRLYVRGDGLGNAWSSPSTFSGDASTLSVSMNEPVTVSGMVMNDVNGTTDALVNGTGTNTGATLYANLLAGDGKVVASSAIASNGTYSFAAIGAGNYTVSLSTTQGIQGNDGPAVSLPAGYSNSGEGIAAAGDGTPNGSTSITVATTDVTGVDFGVNQYPSASSNTIGAQYNPGNTNQVNIASANFSGTDSDATGQISAYKFTAFPSNVTSIKIAGVTYTAASFPIAGVTVMASSGALPANTISIDPIDGHVSVVIPYKTIDNGALESSVAANVTINFTSMLPLRISNVTASVSGKQIQLKWITEDEINTGYFDVLKSSDALQWKVMTTVKAAGFGNNTYHATDNKAFTGINYYRLRETDKNGQLIFSTIVQATLTAEIAETCTVNPNPVAASAVLEVNSMREEEKAITLSDARGNAITSFTVKAVKGVNYFTIPNIGEKPKGVYYISIKNSDGKLMATCRMLKL